MCLAVFRLGQLCCICLVILSCLGCFADEAQAGQFRVAVGFGGAGTEWRGDGSGHGQLKFGYRFNSIIGAYADLQLGYSVVDQRVTTMLAIGVQAWAHWGPLWPYARLSLVHQHEESLSVIAGEFHKAILGIGEGIRHRGGFALALGTDWMILKKKRLELFASVEAYAKWFPGDMGPAVYVGGLLGFGMHYSI